MEILLTCDCICINGHINLNYFPHNSKTHEELQTILREVGLVTNKDDDLDSGIVTLGCKANSKFLCLKSLAIFADETYKCCSKFFTQLCIIHGFKKYDPYTPLRFLSFLQSLETVIEICLHF